MSHHIRTFFLCLHTFFDKCTRSNSGFSVLPKNTLPGIKPPTFKLADDLLCFMSHKTSNVANLARRHKNKCHWSHNWSVLAIQCLDYDKQNLILEFLCCVCSCQATLKY